MIDYDFIIPPSPRQCFFKKIMQYLENILDTLNYNILNRDLGRKIASSGEADEFKLGHFFEGVFYTLPPYAGFFYAAVRLVVCPCGRNIVY